MSPQRLNRTPGAEKKLCSIAPFLLSRALIFQPQKWGHSPGRKPTHACIKQIFSVPGRAFIVNYASQSGKCVNVQLNNLLNIGEMRGNWCKGAEVSGQTFAIPYSFILMEQGWQK